MINATINGRPTPEYTAWKHMLNRCYKPNCKEYNRYGGRGITVCARWKNSFEDFFSDMGKRLSPVHSLDRIENNGNYEKSNCAWRTKPEQLRNTRRNRWFECNGIRMVLVDWAKKWSISYQAIQKQLNYGRSFEEIYNLHENGIKKSRKIDIITKNSRVIEVIENGVLVREYPSIAIAVRSEKISKIKILDHLNGVKRIRNKKDSSKNMIVPYDYSNSSNTFRVRQ